MTPSQRDFDPPSAPSRHPSRDAGTSRPGAASADRAADAGVVLDRSLELVRFLRANCDWDAAQTPDSLLPYLLEEAHEVAEAVAERNDADLQGELGDLLLNVAFQIVLAEERAAFTAEDVVRRLEAKMIRRHPHLYGGGPRQDWEKLKASERAVEDAERGGAPRSLLHGVAAGLEPLSRAQRMQERVATVGFDWPTAQGAFDKLAEELEEVRELLHEGSAERVEEEIGDLLFAAVNLARLSGTHAMLALRKANAKFAARFTALEALAAERGVAVGEATLEELDVLWDEVKARLKE